MSILTLMLATAAQLIAPDPASVSRRISEQFLATRPDCYAPEGTTGFQYGGSNTIHYATCSLWVNALECARISGQKDLEKRLIAAYQALPRDSTSIWNRIKHVDYEIVGAVPLEIAILSKDKTAGELGLFYADRQWEKPEAGDDTKKGPPFTLKERMGWWKKGFSPETRLWIDDMYMMSVLQLQAYRYTGDFKYLDRISREMLLYLDRLPQRDGLFCHSDTSHFAWGRGNGWMAAAMAMVLRELNIASQEYALVLARYQKMMAALLKWQRPNGLWGQLVDDAQSWDETSGSAMFAYAFAEGVRKGWLGPEYRPAMEKAYRALVANLDKDANLADVCVGTGARANRDWYLNRPRVCGDPHGQAPMLWLCRSLIEMQGEFPADRHVASREERLRVIDPVPVGMLLIRPTFCSASVYYGAESVRPGIRLEYRERADSTGSWRQAEPMPYFAEAQNYRGSVFGLKEDTEYEVRLDGRTSVFRTWKSKVPVAKTVVVDPQTVKLPLRITDKGSDAGWVRYTMPRGTVLENEADCPALFVIDGASHVLFDDFVVKGGPARHIVNVVSSECVRVRNCDFSHWGRSGEVNFDFDGRQKNARGQYWTVKEDGSFGAPINYDAAIVIGEGTSEAVVERCYVHDPNGKSASWYYCHPAGPEAVHMCRPRHSTVLRWNNFVASDAHRWNDAVEGEGNFWEEGGFNRDADIYGNFMFGCNDDSIELDGGQQNVRSFGNRYECSLMGVSIQGCMVSPVYLIGDLFVDLCDENGLAISCVKTSSFDRYGQNPYAKLKRLSGYGRGSGPLVSGLRCPANFVQTDCSYEQTLENWAVFDRPVRNVPFTLDVGRIGGVKVSKGVATPSVVPVRLCHNGKGSDVAFSVRVNDDTPWLRVTPASGVLKRGDTVRLQVAFDATLMTGRRSWRGAFIVSDTNGMARVCSVHAESDYMPALRPDPLAVYVECEGRPADQKEQCLEFEIPEDGRYMLALHGQQTPDGKGRSICQVSGMSAAVDDDPSQVCDFLALDYPAWTLLAPGSGQNRRFRWYDLKKGRHSVRIRLEKGGYAYDRLAATKDPAAFDPFRASDFKQAGLAILSPADGAEVCALKPEQKEFLSLSRAERRRRFLDRSWRHRIVQPDILADPDPIRLTWRSRRPSCEVRLFKGADEVLVTNLTAKALDVWNLEIARDYMWTVSDGASCVTGRFHTADFAPRNMHIPDVGNVRDLGGRIGMDGRRVRQGLVFRSAGLNRNANIYCTTEEVLKLYEDGELEKQYGEVGAELKEQIDEEKRENRFDPLAHYLRKRLLKERCVGANFITPESIRYVTETLGWKSDLDLRRDGECWGMTGSPCGPSVKWWHSPSLSYGRMSSPEAKEAFAYDFRVFLDRQNYPIVFHCIGGADRTGSLGFILNALLGVSDEELDKDWEFTVFTIEWQNFGHETRFDKLRAVFDAYPGNSTREKVEAYVRDTGITDDEIARFRSIMLEGCAQK